MVHPRVHHVPWLKSAVAEDALAKLALSWRNRCTPAGVFGVRKRKLKSTFMSFKS